MLPLEVVEAADGWWARDFGCAAGELRPDATRVQIHTGGLAGNAGIWILRVGDHPLVSLPPSVFPVLQQRARSWSRQTIEDPATLAGEIAPLVARAIIGPAFIGYATAESLRGAGAGGARQLDDRDEALVAALRSHCDSVEWEHGGSEVGQVPTFGAFDGTGELAAMAGYETWDRIAHISIVSGRHLRGRGFAAAAVSAAAAHALRSGLIPQYRTLESNGPSMAVARKLGFQQYGVSVYVKLGEAPGVD